MRALGRSGAKLGEGFIHGEKPTELELTGEARGALVAGDHGARAMACAIGDPGFRAAKSEGEGDEAGAQVVHADALSAYTMGRP
jgi:hypothetical protein